MKTRRLKFFLILAYLFLGAALGVGVHAQDTPAAAANTEILPLEKTVFDLRTRTDDILIQESVRHGRALQDIQAFQGGLAERRRELQEVLDLSPLADERGQRIDTLYLASHAAVADLRRWLATERAVQEQANIEDRKQLATWAEGLPKGTVRENSAEMAELLTAWSAAHGEYVEALAIREHNWLAERDVAYQILSGCKQDRRRLRDVASDLVRQQVRKDFFRELDEEIREIPEVLSMHQRRWITNYRRLPLLLGDFNLLQSLVTSGTALLLLLWLWWTLRRSSGTWLASWLQAIAYRRRETRRGLDDLSWLADPTAVSSLAKSAAPTLRRLADLGALSVLYYGFVRPMPLLALPVLLLSLWTLYRLVPEIVRLAIAIPGERRPGLVITSAESRRRAVGNARWLCGTLLGYGVLLALVRDVLIGDRLAEVVARGITFLFLLLVATLLLGWYPTLRRHAIAHLPPGRLQRWFDTTEPGILGRLLRSLGGALILLALAGAHLADRYGNVEWLGSFIARRELQQASSVRQPLGPEVRQAIREATDRWIPPQDAITCLSEAFGRWRETGRRGLMAVTGGRGMGKSTFLERVPEILSRGENDGAETLEVVHLRLEVRPFGAEAARTWLAGALAIEGVEDPTRELLLEALEERPPSLFLLDDLQFLLLRTVGGFAALREILAITHRSSSRHFWVMACHGPSWAYMAGVAINFHLEVFRERIVLAPWKAEELAAWLEKGTRKAGYEPRYRPLVPGKGRLDPGYRLERAREAFWRLLGETSRGNPEVAMGHWLDSLCQANGRKGLETTAHRTANGETHAVDVTLITGPLTEEVEALDGDDLFVLTSLMLHSRMHQEHLALSLNLPLGPLEVDCRHLEELGIIERLKNRDLAVTSRWYPSVVRVLRQKHFLHRS